MSTRVDGERSLLGMVFVMLHSHLQRGARSTGISDCPSTRSRRYVAQRVRGSVTVWGADARWQRSTASCPLLVDRPPSVDRPPRVDRPPNESLLDSSRQHPLSDMKTTALTWLTMPVCDVMLISESSINPLIEQLKSDGSSSGGSIPIAIWHRSLVLPADARHLCRLNAAAGLSSDKLCGELVNRSA